MTHDNWQDQKKDAAEAAKAFAESDIGLFDTGNFADATITCGDKTWKVHKAILASRSAWFKAAFRSDFEEGLTGMVKFPEHDPEEIAWLLHYLYEKDIDFHALRDGKDFPTSCVTVWRLGDYFQVKTLTAKADKELGGYLDRILMLVCDNFEKTWAADHPRQVAELLRAVKEAYRDNQSKSMQGMLVGFFWAARCSGILGADVVMCMMDELPVFGKDILKILVRRDVSLVSPWIPASSAAVSDDKRPHTASEKKCGGCNKPVKKSWHARLYDPFSVDHQIAARESQWCRICASRMRNENEIPWRRRT